MVQRGYLWHWRWQWAGSHERGEGGDSQLRAEAARNMTAYALRQRCYPQKKW